MIFIWVAYISNIFWVLDIPDIFGGDAGLEPMYVEKMSVSLRVATLCA